MMHILHDGDVVLVLDKLYAVLREKPRPISYTPDSSLREVSDPLWR